MTKLSSEEEATKRKRKEELARKRNKIAENMDVRLFEDEKSCYWCYSCKTSVLDDEIYAYCSKGYFPQVAELNNMRLKRKDDLEFACGCTEYDDPEYCGK
ncbi:MAG: hypothetical protein WC476_00860 [Phycisphaerae bacterium]